jgi:hypothetical protein
MNFLFMRLLLCPVTHPPTLPPLLCDQNTNKHDASRLCLTIVLHGCATVVPLLQGEGPPMPPALPKVRNPAKEESQKKNADMEAAFIDVEVAGRIYHKGSGERHVAHMPSYPTFEGYRLEVRWGQQDTHACACGCACACACMHTIIK